MAANQRHQSQSSAAGPAVPNRTNRKGASTDRSGLRDTLLSLPGTLVAATVLVMLFTGAFAGSLGAVHILLLVSVLAAGALRIALSPSGPSPIVALTRHTDMVLLPLAAIQIAAAALGTDQSLVFPLTLLVMVWAASALDRRALIAAVAYAGLSQLAAFIGRGAWVGHAGELISNLFFIASFTVGGAVLLRHEVKAVRRRTATGRTRLEEQVGDKARTLGLESPARDVQQPDIRVRVAELGTTFQRTLAIARRAVRANSAILLMRDGDESFRLMEAATRETDLNRAPISVHGGMMAALLRHEDGEAGKEPVLRISPLEGRNAELPYYTHTPARIKSTMALALRRADGTVDGVLWFDRTAGEGFDDRDAEYARVAGAILSRILDTERTVIATTERSELLDRLAEGSQLLSEALEPSDAHEAILRAAGRLTPLRFGALVQRRSDGRGLEVVYAAGEGAEDFVEGTIKAGPSLPQVVVKTQAAMPPGYEWNPAHGPLLGSLGGPELVEGEAVIALPLCAQQESVGALLLVGTRPFEPSVVSTLELLTTQAAVLLRHADAVAELRGRASRDALTDLDNRDTIHRRLQEAFARGDRTGHQTAILMLDLDHFKAVNDTHGHQLGDVVLQRVAAVLRDSKRVNDTAGRFGGEEFVMVLEGTTEAGARLVAERIRQRIEKLPFEGPHGPFNVTTSIGMALAPDDGARPEDIIQKADKALYQAKHAGRNRIRVYGRAIPAPALAPAPVVEASPPM